MTDLLATAVRHAASMTADPAAIATNTRTARSRTQAQVMAVVKADGFGHGAVDVSRAALNAGATWLGVTNLAEEVPLREADLRASLLNWLNPVEVDVATAVHHDIDLAVASVAHLDRIVAHGTGVRGPLHLDTGLARDGAPPTQWDALCAALRRAQTAGHVGVVGVTGDLACRRPGDCGQPRGSSGIPSRLRSRAPSRATRIDAVSRRYGRRIDGSGQSLRPSPDGCRARRDRPVRPHTVTACDDPDSARRGGA